MRDMEREMEREMDRDEEKVYNPQLFDYTPR